MRPSVRIALAVLGAVLAAPASAHAYPQDPNNCNDSTISWQFTSDWNAYPTATSWARSAINLWNQPLDYGGARLETLTETSSGDVEVDLASMPDNDYGNSSCDFLATYIELNMNHLGSQPFVYQTARHEMGHLLGGEHSGDEDSWNVDNPPTMATCIDLSAFSSSNRLTQDDQAYMNWLHGVLPNRQLHANIGYEQGVGLWGHSGGTTEWLSAGGATGPGHIRYKTATYTSYVYQTVNVAVGDDNLPYRAVFNYKVASGMDGVAEGRLVRQDISYPGDNACDYADGLHDLNHPSYSSSGFVNMNSTGIKDLGGVTSWTSAASSWVDPPNANGYHLQVRVYANATDAGGTDQWVYLDNVRGEGQ